MKNNKIVRNFALFNFLQIYKTPRSGNNYKRDNARGRNGGKVIVDNRMTITMSCENVVRIESVEEETEETGRDTSWERQIERNRERERERGGVAKKERKGKG